MSEPLVIVGNGMAAARLCEELAQRALGRYAVAVIGEEPRLAYNRVLLSSVLAGEIAANDISLKPASWWSDRGVTLGAVAQIGNAFGMKVIAWSQNLTIDRAAEVGATLVSRDEVFREADVVTIHLVLSGRTRGLVGAAELALMKPTSRLINTRADRSRSRRISLRHLRTRSSPAPPSMSSTRSRCRSTIRSARCRTCWQRHISATSPAASTLAASRLSRFRHFDRCTASQEIGRCCPRLSCLDDVAVWRMAQTIWEGPDGNRF